MTTRWEKTLLVIKSTIAVQAQPAALNSPTGELDSAILRTVLYADVFEFPMRVEEIHFFLIGCSAPREAVDSALAHSAWLQQYVGIIHGYVLLRRRDYTVELRKTREAASVRLWQQARRWGAVLARLPFVRMVALTGALAMRNAENDADDLDFFIVTAPHRVWTARAASIVMVRLARLGGVHLCPNYILAETALEQDRKDLFMAHEIAQMIPLSGFDTYDAMRKANPWTSGYLPNAQTPFYREQATDLPGRFLQRLAELLLGGALGDAFEKWERNRKIRRFAAQLQRANASAQLDADHVKGHFNDYGYPTLDHYHEGLKRYGLDDVERSS